MHAQMALWSQERTAAAIRLMMYLWMRRRASWNVHRRICDPCRAWDATAADWPPCGPGVRRLSEVRQARDAIRILNKQLDQAATAEPTLF